MLHQYGKRFLRQKTRRETAKRIETRDAILWDVFPDDKYCRVKIQGSNTLIKAQYPENWQQTPTYLKPGNAVRIQHIGGNRNRIEIIGNGGTIPTPTGASMFPAAEAGQDAVLSGCTVNSLEDPDMYVWIETGTCRIVGVTYSLEAMTASESNPATAAMAVPIDITAAVIAVDAAHSSLFRMDAFVVGTDGVVDYVKGTAAEAPSLPDTPGGHIQLGWVLVPPGATTIPGSMVNAAYVEPFVSQVVAEVSVETLSYEEIEEVIVWDTEATVTVSVRDQYGNLMTGTNWGILAEFESGDGELDEEYPSLTKYLGTDATGTFDYVRTAPETDETPIIKFTLVQDPSLFGYAAIFLYKYLGAGP
jgi:hypothetical protein